jgi:uncharacterized damage-inducible protein DinB
MDDGDKEILADFQRSRRKTMDLLKSVPDAMLKRTAKGERETAGELFHHIAGVVDGWMLRCMKDGGPPPNWSLKTTPSKAQLLKELSASEKRLLKYFKARRGAAMNTTFGGEWKGKTYKFKGRNRVTYLTQHEAHHRGKIVLALRQWGFTKIPFLPFE